MEEGGRQYNDMRKGFRASAAISMTVRKVPTTVKLQCCCYFNACRHQAGLMGMSTMQVDVNICSSDQGVCGYRHQEGAGPKAMAMLQWLEHKAGGGQPCC